MSNIFLIIFLLSPILLLIGLVRPSIFLKYLPTRKKIALVFVSLTVLSFVFFGMTVPATSDIKQKDSLVVEDQQIAGIKTEETLSPSPAPTSTSDSNLIQLIKATAKSTSNYFTPVPIISVSGGHYICNCSKTCSQISSCVEAQYQLNVCGCSTRDADRDGIACDSQCQ